VDGVDDLAAVDPLQVDARDPEVRVTELALDDDQRDALPGHLDSVSMPKLVGRKAPAQSSCRPQTSKPTSRRRPPLPRRTKMLPRDASRSLSASDSASLIRRPARHSTTISARVRKP